MNRAIRDISSVDGSSDGMPVLESKGSPRLGQYLRGLRNGYGYSLRKVEEKARLHGGEIDNSQLSRYEKGLCYPSFDKLRTLARIFNVSIQTFSDVVDLEELEKNEPESNDPAELLHSGNEEIRLGDYGKAYAHYQKARRLLEEREETPSPTTAAELAKARLAAAISLFRMGKISLAEYELRQLLRLERHVDHATIARALLQLSNGHHAFGDFLLAEVGAARALSIAEKQEDRQLQAYAHHQLGRVHQDREEHDSALNHYHQALARYRDCGDLYEALKVKMNLGPIYAARGQFREGERLLKEARDEARSLGHRRTVAGACAWLAEINFRRGELEQAKGYIRESNLIASSGDAQYVDVLFTNAFYLWKIAQAENSPSEAKIAIGRLKYLRPSLERISPEVREFDNFIERGGHK